MLTFDYVIVGAGSAGCVLASRLSEDPQVQVALIESGPADTSAFIHCPGGLAALSRLPFTQGLQATPQAALQGRTGYHPRGRVLGGSSSVNAMCYVRGQPQDYDVWAQWGNPGWAWPDVLPYFRRAEHNARFFNAWHGQNGPLQVSDLLSPNPYSRRFVQAGVQAGHLHNEDFNGEHQEGVGLYQVTQKDGERCSAARAYLTPHLQRPNLTVLTQTLVEKVLFEQGIARGVQARRGQELLKLEARREVLVCAGAFESPALLMRSGLGPGAALQAQGIEVLHHLPGVGQNLHDHPDVVLVVETPWASDLFGLSPLGLWHVLQGVRQWRAHRRGRLTTNFAEAGGFIRSQAGLADPDIQLHFVVAKLVDHGRKLVTGHGYSLHVCLLQPLSRGQVRLASPDPATPPLIDPQFLSHPDDLPRLMAGVREARRILAQPALASHGREWASSRLAQSDEALARWVRSSADTIYHPVGTCKMGPDDMAVVDAQLRVHGVQGLRVVDASVMPRIVSGNTNAPTLMIAEKAADLIRGAAHL